MSGILEESIVDEGILSVKSRIPPTLERHLQPVVSVYHNAVALCVIGLCVSQERETPLCIPLSIPVRLKVELYQHHGSFYA